MSDRIDALKTLHTSLVDSRNGYDEAMKQGDGSALRPLFSEMMALRDKAAGELSVVLTSLGEKADASGSFMSTVHRTVIDIRSYITGLDENILPSLISGEERILANYDEALKEISSSDPEHPTLVKQRAALTAKIAEMEMMKARDAA